MGIDLGSSLCPGGRRVFCRFGCLIGFFGVVRTLRLSLWRMDGLGQFFAGGQWGWSWDYWVFACGWAPFYSWGNFDDSWGNFDD